MVKTADAVVIGAGVNGASTAFNLARAGLRKVVLLEKGLIASGGTGRSAAIIRQHYSHPDLVRLVKRSLEIFHHFDDQIGGSPGFVNCGWAFLVPEYVSEGFGRNLEMQRSLGIDTREIDRRQLLEMEPRIDLSGVDRIAWEPGAGYADPHATTAAYVQRFRDRGGQLLPLTPVEDLRVEGGRIAGVLTGQGEISTGVVVNAAGPWAGRVARWAGVEAPIQVTREEEILMETAEVGGPPRLVFSDMAKAIYYRPHGASRTLVGRGYPKEYRQVDPERLRAVGRRRLHPGDPGPVPAAFPLLRKGAGDRRLYRPLRRDPGLEPHFGEGGGGGGVLHVRGLQRPRLQDRPRSG